MGVIISVFVWVFTLAIQALFYLVMAIIDLLAHLFGGVFAVASEKMHNKKKGKKAKLKTKSGMADMNNVLDNVLDRANPQAKARSINLTRTLEGNVVINCSPQTLSDALFYLAITCFQLSPVHVDIFCYDHGNYIIAGARCLNAKTNVAQLAKISEENENFRRACTLLQTINSKISPQSSGNDVTYCFRVDY